MNQERPHDIQRFEDGSAIPTGYVELTCEQLKTLEPMSVSERSAWLQDNAARSPLGVLQDALSKKETGSDYNDQCDLVYGRMRRLLAETEELDPLGVTLDGMLHAGLAVKGLGLSGGQVEAVFCVVKAEALALHQFQDALEDAWGVIANASDWNDSAGKEWRVAAERWRDGHFTNLRTSNIHAAPEGDPPIGTPE